MKAFTDIIAANRDAYNRVITAANVLTISAPIFGKDAQVYAAENFTRKCNALLEDLGKSGFFNK